MTPDYSEDDGWIQQALKGDREAFGNLIAKYQGKLFDMAVRILGNRSDAEDVLQDVFLAAYRHLSNFNHDSKFSTWIYSIALNRIRNHLRRSRILKWSSLDLRIETEDGSEPLEIPENGPTLDEVTEKTLLLEAVKREVRALPLQYQSMFIMHYFQTLPLEEIAERLDRPIGTVKAYLHRSRKLLYKRLVVDRTAPSAPPKPARNKHLAQVT